MAISSLVDWFKIMRAVFSLNNLTLGDLRKFGWNENVFNNAKIIEFKKD